MSRVRMFCRHRLATGCASVAMFALVTMVALTTMVAPGAFAQDAASPQTATTGSVAATDALDASAANDALDANDAIAAAAGMDLPTLTAAAQVRDRADVIEIARRLAAEPMLPAGAAPRGLGELSYGDYVRLRYKPGAAYWTDIESPFWLETFHQGFVQKNEIALFELSGGFGNRSPVNRWIPFDPARFDYGDLEIAPETLNRAGHAGLKIAGRFEPEGDWQEMLTFLGSSYFRARSGKTIYGCSARGLAVDIALPRDEEFPFFRTFWVRRPEPGDEAIEILALMDSKSCTGAYEFRMTPGMISSTVDVSATVFCRDAIEKLAIAPLTGMWMWGDGLPGPSLDRRSHVHDCDALLIDTDDAAPIVRPFARIAYPSVSRYPIETLRGFGLIQRRRDAKSFGDQNARYGDRPSVMVRPRAPDRWIGGVIELLEIPGAHEGVDNIGAYWIPPEPAKRSSRFDIEYAVDFTRSDRFEPRVSIARMERLDVTRPNGGVRLTADYRGDAIAAMPLGELSLGIATVRGEVTSQQIKSIAGGVRIVLDIRPTEPAPTEVRIDIKRGDALVAERLAYLCPPDHPKFVFPAVYTKTE